MSIHECCKNSLILYQSSSLFFSTKHSSTVIYLLIGSAQTSLQFTRKVQKIMPEITAQLHYFFSLQIIRKLHKKVDNETSYWSNSPKQFGFISGRSTTTQLMKYLDNCLETIVNVNVVDTIYLDFAKAFDSVPHRRLLGKLESYGVTGNILNWIKAFISGQSQVVSQWYKFYACPCLKWYSARKCPRVNLVHSLHHRSSWGNSLRWATIRRRRKDLQPNLRMMLLLCKVI